MKNIIEDHFDKIEKKRLKISEKNKLAEEGEERKAERCFARIFKGYEDYFEPIDGKYSEIKIIGTNYFLEFHFGFYFRTDGCKCNDFHFNTIKNIDDFFEVLAMHELITPLSNVYTSLYDIFYLSCRHWFIDPECPHSGTKGNLDLVLKEMKNYPDLSLQDLHLDVWEMTHS